MAEGDTRNFDQWQLPCYNHFSSKAFFNEGELNSGIHYFQENNQYIDLYLRKHRDDNSTLLVFFNGAVNYNVRQAGVFPIFSGIHVSWGLKSHILCFSDPGLHASKEVSLGWYVGDTGLDYAAICADIIRSVASRIGSSTTILFGGSNGGFAALNIGLMLGDCTTVCVNPRTNIALYGEAATSAFAKNLYHVPNISAVPAAISNQKRFDLCRFYDASHKNAVIYLQNRTDRHFQVHAAPFIAAVGSPPVSEPGVHRLSDRFVFFLGEWGEGHVAPPKPALKSLLNDICTCGKADNLLDQAKASIERNFLANNQ